MSLYRKLTGLSSSCRAVVGELDEDLDKELDLGSTRAAPLKSIVHAWGSWIAGIARPQSYCPDPTMSQRYIIIYIAGSLESLLRVPGLLWHLSIAFGKALSYCRLVQGTMSHQICCSVKEHSIWFALRLQLYRHWYSLCKWKSGSQWNCIPVNADSRSSQKS